MRPPAESRTRVGPAESLWSRVADGDGHVLIEGASGSGKTHLLEGLERTCRAIGRPVVRAVETSAFTPGAVVCVDDAHLLPAESLRALLHDADAAGATLVLTTAPPTDDGAAAEALGSLGIRAPIVLEPWGLEDVEACLDLWEGDRSALEAMDLLDQTLGLPWLVAAAVGSPGTATAPSPAVQDAVVARWRSLSEPDAATAVAVACGYRLSTEPVPPDLAAAEPAVFAGTVGRLVAAGLVAPDGDMPELVASGILRLATPHQLRGLRHRVVDDLCRVEGDLARVARRLVAAGVHDERLVRALERCADGLLPERAAMAADHYALAASVVAEPIRLRLRQVEAEALSGDVRTAAGLLDRQGLELATDPLSSTAGALAAHLAALGGRVDHAASLWRWRAAQVRAGGKPDRRDAEGALVLYGLGDLSAGDVLREGVLSLCPDLVSDGLSGALEPVRLSLGEGAEAHGHAAVSGLVRAGQGLSMRRTRLQPDHPAALAAIAATSWGDLPTAEAVLQGIPAEVPLGVPDASRLAAVRGWVDMAAGHYAEAAEATHSVDERIHRDRVWRAALDVGLARRQDDLAALTRLWVAARAALVAATPDLFSVLPLSELAVVAARMREPHLARPVMARLESVLALAGPHSLWSAPFHWAGIQMAIQVDEPKALAPHVTALTAMARHNPTAGVLVNAARSWVGVLRREVDVAEVTGSARRLRDVGLAWDGARLAGHGAARADSRKASAALLEVARDLRSASRPTGVEGPGGSEAAQTLAGQRAGLVELSRREREVVELVVGGMTYREVGEALFLSPKTVEHHMARIRRRSGAASRGELLRRLNATLAMVPPLPGTIRDGGATPPRPEVEAVTAPPRR